MATTFARANPVAKPAVGAGVVAAAEAAAGAEQEGTVNAGRVGRMTMNHEESRCRLRRWNSKAKLLSSS